MVSIRKQSIIKHNIVTGQVDLSDIGKATWGNIIGDIADQSDLTEKIDEKIGDIVIPTKTSELTNDSGYLTEHQSLKGYATENWVESKNYLTEHQDISGKQDKLTDAQLANLNADHSKYLTEHQDLSGYVTLDKYNQENTYGAVGKYTTTVYYYAEQWFGVDTNYVNFNGIGGYINPTTITLGHGSLITGETGNDKRNHAIALGYPNHDVMDFYEYGGDFVFHKYQDGADTVIAEITESGIKENGTLLRDKYQMKINWDSSDFNITEYSDGSIFVDANIPTKTSDLDNDSGYVTESEVINCATVSDLIFRVATLEQYKQDNLTDDQIANLNLDHSKYLTSESATSIVKLTQTEYDALTTKDSSTIYLITEE